MSSCTTKPTKWHVRPAKTQISLGIRPVWSEFSLFAWRKFGPKLPIKRTAKTLIRLGRCPGWSEFSLGAQVILFVLSYIGSFIYFVGNWSISCHNDEHFEKGMKAMYSVEPCGTYSGPFYQESGTTRTYYIAAVERKWNYSPNTIHPLTGENYSDPTS